MELWLRRPLLRPMRSGGNQSFHPAPLLRRDVAAGRPARPRGDRRRRASTSACRGEQRDDGDGQLRLAGLRISPAPDRTPRRADADAAGAGPLPRRSLRHDRSAAALPREFVSVLALLDRLGLRVGSRLGHPPARRRRERLNLADIETDPLVAEIFHLGATSCGSWPSASTPWTSSSRRSASGWPRAPSTRRARPCRPAPWRAVSRSDRAPRAAAVDHLPETPLPLHGDPVGGPPRSPPRRALTESGRPHHLGGIDTLGEIFWIRYNSAQIPTAARPVRALWMENGDGRDGGVGETRGAGRDRRLGSRGARPVHRRRPRWRRAGPACRGTGRRRPG